MSLSYVCEGIQITKEGKSDRAPALILYAESLAEKKPQEAKEGTGND